MGIRTEYTYPGIKEIESRMSHLRIVAKNGKDAEKELASLEPVYKKLIELAEARNKIVHVVASSNEELPLGKKNEREGAPYLGASVTDAIMYCLKTYGDKSGIEIYKMVSAFDAFREQEPKGLKGVIYATLSRLYNKQGLITKVGDKWHLK